MPEKGKDFRALIKQKLNDQVKYVSQCDEFLKNLINTTFIKPRIEKDIYFLILREWNSFYPSFYDVNGGCYVFCVWGYYIIIDPGYGTLKKLREAHIDTHQIHAIILTHNHLDHQGGLPELLDLLFSQSNGKMEYFLYVNKGMENAYKYFESPKNKLGLRVQEIEPDRIQNILNLEEGKIQVNITGYKVPHNGIGDQTSLAYIFEVQDYKFKTRFGISGDMDGNSEYLEMYKKIFSDLRFLILHLGSLRCSNPDKKFKHLYLDGLCRVIDCLSQNKVDSFIIQEFGLEMAPPHILADKLSSVLFNNSYYFPYLIIRLKNTKSLLEELLFPQLLEKFIDKLANGYQTPREKGYLDLQDFCSILCLRYASSGKSIIENFWIKSPESIKASIAKKFDDIINELADHYLKSLYLGIEDFEPSRIDSFIKELNLQFQDEVNIQPLQDNI